MVRVQFVYNLYTFRCILFEHTSCIHVYTCKKVFIERYTKEYTRVYNTTPEIGASVYLVFNVYNRYTTVYNRCTSCLCTHRYTFRYTVQSTQTLGGVSHSICIPNVYSKIVYYVCILFVYSFCKYAHSHMYTFSIRVYSSTQDVRYGLGEVCRSELKQRRYSKGIR